MIREDLQAIAKALGNEWHLEQPDMNANVFFFVTGSVVRIKIDYKPKSRSLAIIGYIDPKINGFKGVKGIGISFAKSTKAIVNDLNSRLISLTDKVLSTAQQKQEEAVEEAAEDILRAETLQMLQDNSSSDWDDLGYGKYKLTQDEVIKSDRLRQRLGKDIRAIDKGMVHQDNLDPERFNLNLKNITTEQTLQILTLLGL